MKNTISVFVVSILFSINLYSQNIQVEKFMSDAPSIIQFYQFERAIQSNEEMVAYYFALGNDDWHTDINLVKDANREERKLKLSIEKTVVDKQYEPLRKQTDSLMDIIIECFDNLYKYGPQSKEFKHSNKVYQPKLEIHLNNFFKQFSLNNYIEIDSAAVQNEKSKACKISFNTKNEADKLLSENKPYTAYQVIVNDSSYRNNTGALLYLANIVLKHKYKDSINGKLQDNDSLGIAYLQRILSRNSYSPLLEETWLKWRCITQFQYGSSKTSEIPNDTYDSVRFSLMNIIVNYLKSSPSDTWAYIQFFELANEEIIHRFGSYPFGNQNAIEFNELFYEK